MQVGNCVDAWRKYGLWGLALVVLAGLHAATFYNYLVFHTVVEVFAIVVACGIFMFAWNSRDVSDNSYLLFLGIAYLFVAGLDLLHALAYEGLGLFPGHSTDLATQLWIAARYTESLALLLAALLAGRRVHAGAVFAGFAAATVVILLSVFYWRIFPVCFADGFGLTAFKKGSEYVISAVLLGSAVLLWRRRSAFDRHVLYMIIASILLTVASELSFTLYRGAYDVANEIGHFLKLISFYLIYRAVIQTGVRRPFAVLLRDLKQSNDVLEMRNKELRRFAEVLRHDLGNSLFSVEAFAGCIDSYCREVGADLESEPLIGERRDQILSLVTGEIPRSTASIRESVALMRKLLEGLRQVAAVGHRPMHVVEVDMNELLHQVAQSLEPRFTAADMCLHVDNLPTCMGDVVQLNEVFGNLLDNAIKYRDGHRQGRVHISGRSQDGMSVYCVEDNGIGIAPEAHERIFEIFQRLHPSDAVGGEGLGLSIVHRLVERHGGRIWLESEPGRGSRFFVALLGRAASPRKAPPLVTTVETV